MRRSPAPPPPWSTAPGSPTALPARFSRSSSSARSAASPPRAPAPGWGRRGATTQARDPDRRKTEELKYNLLKKESQKTPKYDTINYDDNGTVENELYGIFTNDKWVRFRVAL